MRTEIPPFSLSRPAAACLPEELTSGADGRVYAVDPDFRTVLLCLRVLGDPDRPALGKLICLGRRFYRGQPPPDAGAPDSCASAQMGVHLL